MRRRKIYETKILVCSRDRWRGGGGGGGGGEKSKTCQNAAHFIAFTCLELANDDPVFARRENSWEASFGCFLLYGVSSKLPGVSSAFDTRATRHSTLCQIMFIEALAIFVAKLTMTPEYEQKNEWEERKRSLPINLAIVLFENRRALSLRHFHQRGNLCEI